MQPINKSVITKLDLSSALKDELKTTRNLLPPEPWLEPVGQKIGLTTRWVSTVLESGGHMLPSLTVNARKAGNGVRPVPIVGIAERVAYRALGNAALKGMDRAKRSASEYRDMLRGPVDAGLPRRRRFVFSAARGKYVVESDLASFYQYIDHDILKAEIQIQSGEVHATALLVQLLGEIEQRKFGLPQLLDASDWLSEVYAQIIERDLVRAGLRVWRYNDDFRILVNGGFNHALQAIEKLAESARAVGLTVNESKTRTPSLMTYLLKNTNLKLDDKEAEIDPQDVELIITEYVFDDEEEQILDAEETIARLAPSHDRRIDLKNATGPEIRDLRKAINAFTRNKHASGIDVVFRLFMFVPSLTPRIAYYLIRIAESEHEKVSALFDRLIGSASTSDWQRVWLIYIGRKLDLFALHPDRLEWAEEQRHMGRGSLLGAEASLALAGAQNISMTDLDRAVRMEPEVLAPWYVLAMGIRAGPDASESDMRVLAAIKATSPLYRILLD